MFERFLGTDTEAKSLWEQATQRKVGTNQHSEPLYNVQPLAPTGPSAEAGLRRLRKAAEAGDEKAAESLRSSTEGHGTANVADVDLRDRSQHSFAQSRIEISVKFNRSNDLPVTRWHKKPMHLFPRNCDNANKCWDRLHPGQVQTYDIAPTWILRRRLPPSFERCAR